MHVRLPSIRPSTSRPTRTAQAAAAGVAAVCLVLAGAAPTAEAMVAAGAAGTARGATAASPCATTPEARVRAGMQGADPNSVTPAQQAAMEKNFQQQVAAARARGGIPKRSEDIVVNTYVHVITSSTGAGTVKQSRIEKQMQVLNRGYRGATTPGGVDTHFRFNLAGVDYTANDDWYAWHWLDQSDDKTAKPALHQGGWTDLNVYITDFDPEGLLGYATFPRTTSLARDGVVILNESLPNGNAAPYNEGDTLTHEVGHWLNLYHTFQDGCDYPGDAVSDTPYQDDGLNIFYCDEADDTCPQPGTDPVHNFMSYGDDPCLDQFTAGQADRMYLSWYTLRAR